MLFRFVMAGVSAAALITADGFVNDALAQSSPAQQLPQVDVNRQAAKPRVVRRAPAAGQAVRRAPAAPTTPVAQPENPKGGFPGYVATRTLSGTKTDTPIREIPQAVSVVGSEQIRDQKPQKFDEILRYSPGVRGETFGADTRNDWFLIRGFPAQQDGFFLDGLQLTNSAFATWKLQPFGLERLEVLRGPSAVLYGGSAPGGILNAVSKLPPAEPIRYLEAGINNYGNRFFNFDFGGPVPIDPRNGQLFYRVLGTLKGGDTQVNFTPDDTYFVAPSVTYKPDYDTTITVLAQASKDKTRGVTFLPYEGTVTPAPFGRIPTKFFGGDPTVDRFDREQAMVGYQFERRINDFMTVRQNMRYSTIDLTYNTLLAAGYNGPSANASLTRFSSFNHDIAKLTNIDNQAEFRFATPGLTHKVLAGVDYRYYTLDDVQTFGLTTPISILNPSYGNPGPLPQFAFRNQVLEQRQTGVYLQDQIKFDRFTAVLSGRNDFANLNQTNRNLGGAFQGREDSKATGRAGLIYNGDFGLSPYVSYATGYNPIVGTNPITGRLFLPEQSKQTEVGVKWEPGGFNGSVDLAYFDLTRENALTPNPANILQSIQTGEVKSRGIELSAVSNLTREFKMIGQFTGYNIFISKDVVPTIVGNTPVNTPTRIAALWGDYTFRSGPLTGFGFGTGVRYVGPSFADQANTLVVPSYVVGDAAIHYEWDQWRAAVNLSNFTDRTFVASCSSPTACFYGERLRAIASLAYRW